MPTLVELNRAASEVISLLKSTGEYSNCKIAVIGGLALWNYIQDGRTTEVCDCLWYFVCFVFSGLTVPAGC